MVKKTGGLSVPIMLTCLFLLGASRPAIAENGLSRETLRGLKALNVQVAPIEPGISHEGLTHKRILEDTKRELQKAGIELLSDEEFTRLRRSRSYPLGRLEMMITIKDAGSSDAKIYSTTVRVRQAVFLSRRPVIKVFAPTWEKRTIGYTRDLGPVAEAVRNGVEQFIRDYLSVNP